MKQQHHHGFWHMWGWPVVLGVLTTFGLISALFSDGGLGDILAWIVLGVPCVVCFWYGWCRRPSDKAGES